MQVEFCLSFLYKDVGISGDLGINWGHVENQFIFIQ
jgi:hypothetical protein